MYTQSVRLMYTQGVMLMYTKGVMLMYRQGILLNVVVVVIIFIWFYIYNKVRDDENTAIENCTARRRGGEKVQA